MGPTAASTQRKVLLAEGDPELRRVIEELLQRQGLEVLVAHEGREALQKILAEKPDAILLDSTLLGMAGMDICSILKKNQATRGIPLGFLAGDEDTQAAMTAQRAGAVLVIPKSFKPQQLISSVGVLLAMCRRKTTS